MFNRSIMLATPQGASAVATASAAVSPAVPTSGSAASRKGAKSATSSKPIGGDQEVERHMTSQLPASPDKSVPYLMSDVKFAIVFGELNESFYIKMARTLKFCLYLFGSMAAASGIGGSIVKAMTNAFSDQFVGVLTGVLAVLALIAFALQKAVDFDAQASKFRATRKKFLKLQQSGWGMTASELDQEITEIMMDAPTAGQWLKVLAFNRTCDELDHPEMKIHRPIYTALVSVLA